LEISEEEQSYTDFDWFCLDEADHIGHFATAGFKSLPLSVARSAENLESLTQFFMGLAATTNSRIDASLTPEKRTERFLRSYVAMADRGLFSYDIDTYLTPGIHYYRVASPVQPLRFESLPVHIRQILSLTRLAGVVFAESSLVSYELTLGV